NLIHAEPFRRENEQRFPVATAKHACETAAISVDCLQHFATFADTDTALVRNVCVPDSALSIEADTVGNAVTEVGPSLSVRQAAIGSDIECSKPLAVRLGDDQCRVVGSHRHSVWKRDAVGDLSN